MLIRTEDLRDIESLTIAKPNVQRELTVYFTNGFPQSRTPIVDDMSWDEIRMTSESRIGEYDADKFYKRGPNRLRKRMICASAIMQDGKWIGMAKKVNEELVFVPADDIKSYLVNVTRLVI